MADVPDLSFPHAQYTNISHEDLIFNEKDSLGSGNFASVYRGTYSGTEVAVKKLLIPENENQDAQLLCKFITRELSILNAIRHPNIVDLLGWCQDGKHILLVTELVRGGNLASFLQKNNSGHWPLKAKLSLNIARAMTYLHKNGIMYRDLKPQNILIDHQNSPNYAKLCDFGFARVMNKLPTESTQYQMLTNCGTDIYMSPEAMLDEGYGFPSDVFSFGILLLEIILGNRAVTNDLRREPRSYFELQEETAKSLVPQDCPPTFSALALRCCAYKPENRPTFIGVVEELEEICSGSINSVPLSTAQSESRVEDSQDAATQTSISKLNQEHEKQMAILRQSYEDQIASWRLKYEEKCEENKKLHEQLDKATELELASKLKNTLILRTQSTPTSRPTTEPSKNNTSSDADGPELLKSPLFRRQRENTA